MDVPSESLNLAGIVAVVLQLWVMAASLLMWIAVPRWFPAFHEAIFRNQSRGTATIPIGAAMLLALWLGYAFLSRLVEALISILSLPVPAELDVARVVSGLQLHVAINACMFVVMLAIAQSSADAFQKSALGFTSKHLSWQVLLGILGFLFAFIPVVAVLLLTAYFGLRTDESTHMVLRLITQSDDWRVLGLAILVAAVLAPLLEELVFRVLLQSGLRRFLNPVQAILISSTIFAAVHGFPDALGIFVLALVLGGLYEVRRSYVSVVTLHLMFNSFNLLLAILSAKAVEGSS